MAEKAKPRTHKELIDDYLSIQKLGRKRDMIAMLMQSSISIVLFSWNPAQMGFYHIVAPVLLSLSMCFFFKDFLAFLKIDKIKTVIISKGIGIEKKDSQFGRFFYEALEDFDLHKILFFRSVFNFIFFSVIGYFIYQYLSDIAPSILIKNNTFVLTFSLILSTLTLIVYYFSFYSLTQLQKMEAKPRISL